MIVFGFYSFLVSMMNNNIIAPVLIVALVVGGGAFYGGMKYAQAHPVTGSGMMEGGRAFRTGAGGPGAGGAGNQFGQGRGMGGAASGFVMGEVVSRDATSLTLKIRDGGSKIVLYSTSTRIGKMTEGAMSDLTPGTEVTVMGTNNQDGSVTASQLQIRPAGQPEMGMGARGNRQMPPGGDGGQP